MKWRHCAVGCAAGGTDCVGWWFLEWVVVMIGGVMLYVFRLCLVLTIITEELVMLCIVHPESIVFLLIRMHALPAMAALAPGHLSVRPERCTCMINIEIVTCGVKICWWEGVSVAIFQLQYRSSLC